MSKISEEQVRHVAHLAKLAITDEEVHQFRNQLEAIINFSEQLNELDTTDVEPTTHVLNLHNVFREDIATEGLPKDEVLQNAPQQEAGQFKVPSIMD